VKDSATLYVSSDIFIGIGTLENPKNINRERDKFLSESYVEWREMSGFEL